VYTTSAKKKLRHEALKNGGTHSATRERIEDEGFVRKVLRHNTGPKDEILVSGRHPGGVSVSKYSDDREEGRENA